MDAIYHHNEAARAAVIQYFGLNFWTQMQNKITINYEQNQNQNMHPDDEPQPLSADYDDAFDIPTADLVVPLRQNPFIHELPDDETCSPTELADVWNEPEPNEPWLDTQNYQKKNAAAAERSA
jgi:hypothetical protein